MRATGRFVWRNPELLICPALILLGWLLPTPVINTYPNMLCPMAVLFFLNWAERKTR
jgi:hypothetical protein